VDQVSQLGVTVDDANIVIRIPKAGFPAEAAVIDAADADLQAARQTGDQQAQEAAMLVLFERMYSLLAAVIDRHQQPADRHFTSSQ
jgi:hypothetical protein